MSPILERLLGYIGECSARRRRAPQGSRTKGTAYAERSMQRRNVPAYVSQAIWRILWL